MTKKIKKKKAMTTRDDKAVTQRKWSTDGKEGMRKDTLEKENDNDGNDKERKTTQR